MALLLLLLPSTTLVVIKPREYDIHDAAKRFLKTEERGNAGTVCPGPRICSAAAAAFCIPIRFYSGVWGFSLSGLSTACASVFSIISTVG